MSPNKATMPGDSNSPYTRVESTGQVRSNWQTLGVILGFVIIGTLAWAAVKHDQEDLSNQFVLLRQRQDDVETRLATQHDLLIRLGINMDYLVNNRRGPVPAPTITP